MYTCLNTLGDPDAYFEPIIQNGILIGFNGVREGYIPSLVIVSGKYINSIASNAFNYKLFSNINKLCIYDTSITFLPIYVFTGLTSLRFLDLQGNLRLQSLETGVFIGLSSLRGLYLNNTGLSSLEAGVFTGLSSLRMLYLGGNIELLSLEIGVFTGLSSLQSLYLNNAGLSSLEAGVFDGLYSLQILILYGNRKLKGTLPKYLFRGLNNLQYINTIGTQLSPNGIYQSHSDIETTYPGVFDCPP